MATATNTNEENFGTLNAGGAITVTHWAMRWGNVIAFAKALATSREFVAGDELIIEAGDLDITLTNGDALAAWTKDLLDEYISAHSSTDGGAPRVSLHTGAPGASGNDNEVPSARGYSRQAVELTTAQ